MTVSTIVSFIIALGQISKNVKDLIDMSVAAYIKAEKAKIRKDIRDGIKESINEQNQIDLETTIGSDHAGLPSGLPDTVIVDSLPGVRNP